LHYIIIIINYYIIQNVQSQMLHYTVKRIGETDIFSYTGPHSVCAQ